MISYIYVIFITDFRSIKIDSSSVNGNFKMIVKSLSLTVEPLDLITAERTNKQTLRHVIKLETSEIPFTQKLIL